MKTKAIVFKRGWVKPPTPFTICKDGKKKHSRKWLAFMNFICGQLKYIIVQVKMLDYQSQYYYTTQFIRELEKAGKRTDTDLIKLWLTKSNAYGSATMIKELQTFIKPFIKISKENLKTHLKLYARYSVERERTKSSYSYRYPSKPVKEGYNEYYRWIRLSSDFPYVDFYFFRPQLRLCSRNYSKALFTIISKYLKKRYPKMKTNDYSDFDRLSICKGTDNKLCIGWTPDYWKAEKDIMFRRLPTEEELKVIDDYKHRDYAKYMLSLKTLEIVYNINKSKDDKGE